VLTGGDLGLPLLVDELCARWAHRRAGKELRGSELVRLFGIIG
jgi:hypothetical protein